jgi:hypothetical protein
VAEQEATTPPSGAPASQRKKWTPEQRRVALAFMRAVIDDLKEYMAMTEEDVEEQYRRAGKLHKYEPEKEMEKRFARLVKVHNPPESFVPNIDYYLSLIQDDDDEVTSLSIAWQNNFTINWKFSKEIFD